jgi:50S ribosomal protein L16 3-hydroxylase
MLLQRGSIAHFLNREINMVHFKDISLNTFLTEYWQKKPLVLRNALPNFINPLSPDELAGLALEEDIESRIIHETPDAEPQWHLKRGPFSEKDFTHLPQSHWTLLVQGVDRVIPEVYKLLDHFNFIPQWRIDDVMISFASKRGSVGPHYDNYDVFLFQAMGSREWSITSQQCHPENYTPNLELRIMREFHVEQQFVLDEGDMLYLPAHIGHYGIAQTPECMTYSFGYRSYPGQELLDSFSDYVSEKGSFSTLYPDPDWSKLNNTSEIKAPAWHNAQAMLHQLIQDEELIKSWFGCFTTRLDQQAEHHLPIPLEDDEVDLHDFIEELQEGLGVMRDACCRFAYTTTDSTSHLYINGCEWETTQVSNELIQRLANNRFIPLAELAPFLKEPANQLLLFNLWQLQWLSIEQEH